MTQTDWRRKLIILPVLATVLGLLGTVGFSKRQASRRPNVLFIAVDDLNDWIGSLRGHPDVRTPNLDRLAARGALFTNAFCSAPACNPSRTSLLTGKLPSTTGVHLNPQPFRPVLPDVQTLPQYFMAHGYRVMGGGKIFHGQFPDPPSWHEYFPSQTKTRSDDPLPPGRPLNGIPDTARFDWGPVDVPNEQMGDWKITDWAIEQLERDFDQPFFLAVGIFRPHLPWHVPRRYFDRYHPEAITLPTVNNNDLDDVPPIGVRMAGPDGDHQRVLQHKQWRKAVSAYLASISFADACVGRLLEALDRSAHAQNTIVVLWSDHGWHLGEKLHWQKFTLWEEATRVVLMMVAPGVTRPGLRSQRPVSLLDIYPTLVDLCGLRPKADLDGRSLRPLLVNPAASWDRPALTTHGRNNHALRTERWRYIRYSDGTEELYDRHKDPMEWTNLAGKPEFSRTKRDLAKWLPKDDAPEAPGLDK